MQKVAIVGTGLIGQAWAMIFARAGWSVTLTDPVPGAVEAGLEACRAGLETLASNVRAIQFYEQHGFMIAWRGEKFSSSLGYAIDKVGMNKSLTT